MSFRRCEFLNCLFMIYMYHIKGFTSHAGTVQAPFFPACFLQHTYKMELPPPLFGSKKKNEVKLNINMKLKIKHWAVHGEFTFYFYFTLFCLSKFFDWAPPIKNYATNLTLALCVSYSTRSCELLWLTVNCFLSISTE